MATHAPPQPAASNQLSQGAVPPRPTTTSKSDRPSGESFARAAGDAAATPGSGTELVAGAKFRLDAAPAAGEFRTLAEGPGKNAEGNGTLHELSLSASLERMPVGLNVSIPVRNFRVRNLLAMRAEDLIETQWASGEDLPLSSGDVQLAWSEFEVIDARLAVRVTRLA